MRRATEIRKHYQARLAEASTPHEGRFKFLAEWREALGLGECSRDEKTGVIRSFRESRDDTTGQPKLLKGRMSPYDSSLREMAEGLLGERDFRRYFDPDEKQDLKSLTEAGPGLDPTAFMNINTFNLATTGLLEAQIMENFLNPDFIGDQLVTVRPTRLNGEKMIGLGGIATAAGTITRVTGDHHARTGFGEQYVTTPELVEKAVAIDIDQLTVFHDLTGMVLDRAAGIGDLLGYNRERTILSLATGGTNSYNYNGTAYDTYQATTPWINTAANALETSSDYTLIDTVLDYFAKMTDPTTSREILITPKVLIHAPRRTNVVDRMLNATELRETTNTNTVTISPNLLRGRYTTLNSPILQALLQTATSTTSGIGGLGLTEAQANGYWWLGDPKRAFKWMEAWPLRIKQASASEYVMVDRGIIAAYFANYRGVGAVSEPRYMFRSSKA